jgi:hypothetical protein
MNQESSPDRLAFQVAHTTISPNYPGEVFETPDCQILVASADVSSQDGETDEQRQECENANAARAVRRQQELAIAAPGAGQPTANASQVIFYESSTTSSFLMLPLDMLRAWIKPTYGLQNLGFCGISLSPSPRDARGLAQSQPKGHPDLRTPSLNEYEASRHHEHAWSPRPEP